MHGELPPGCLCMVRTTGRPALTLQLARTHAECAVSCVTSSWFVHRDGACGLVTGRLSGSVRMERVT
eukprot:1329573-Prymnesium_polylepis.1